MVSTPQHYLLLLATLCGMVFLLSYEDSSSRAVAQAVGTPESSIAVPGVQTSPRGKYEYIEITESCTPYLGESCIPVYAGPGIEYEKIYEVHNGMVLKIRSKEGKNGQIWYRVYFDEWLRHPDRIERDWYVPAVAGRIITDDGEQMMSSSTPATSKRIVIDLSDHMIYAYEGNRNFLTTKISTGVESTPTPRGTFHIYKKTPSRYMQGPIKGVTDTPFDLPGVPWNMYFTQDGAVIHGSYWHDRYGTEQSSGCINLPPELAKLLYDWAPLGTTVIVQD